MKAFSGKECLSWKNEVFFFRSEINVVHQQTDCHNHFYYTVDLSLLSVDERFWTLSPILYGIFLLEKK